MGRPRALLTGSNGFTGGYVARELTAAGYDVVGFGNGQKSVELRSIAVNLQDREAVRAAVSSIQPDVVLHLAAIAFVAHDNVDEIYRVNVMGTRNLLEALSQGEHRPKIVVLASSANVYGNADVEEITEDTLPAPANDYAVSKLAMEYLAKIWMDRLPIVITRPFNYSGVGQSEQFLIPKIVAHFRRGAEVIELGNTSVARDFGDVRDVARAYMAIIKAAPVGKTLNICTGVAYSLQNVLDMMRRIAGYEIEVRVNQAFVRNNDIARLVGSHALLARCTDWRVQYSLEQTLSWLYFGE